jgi:hypothetical protein
MAPDLVHLKLIISVVTVPVYFVVAWAFYRRNLWRPYFYFWICLLVEGTALAATHLAGNNRNAILAIYTVAQPPMWILYILMVIDLFQKVFAKFPGIARFAQRVVLLSMVLAFIFAFASMGGDLNTGWSGMSLIARYSVILRAISSALSVYMILIAAFLLWMPVPLPANTIRHSFLFFFYFFVTTGVYYMLNTTRAGYVQMANLLTGALTLVALVSWYFLVQAEGEAVPVVHAAPRASSADLLGRLEALNRTLSRPRD